MDSLYILLLALCLILGLVFVLPKPAVSLAGLGLPIAAIVGAWLRRRSLGALLAPGRISIDRLLWTILGSAGLFVLAISLMRPLIKSLPPEYERQAEDYAREILLIPLGVRALLLVVMAPLCEEIFFRGALLRGFRASWGTLIAVVVSSVLFAISHQLPAQVIATFALGLWFGSLAARTGGLAAPVLAHAVNNGLVLALLEHRPEGLPVWAAAPGAVVFGVSAWKLFRTVQGSAGSAAS